MASTITASSTSDEIIARANKALKERQRNGLPARPVQDKLIGLAESLKEQNGSLRAERDRQEEKIKNLRKLVASKDEEIETIKASASEAADKFAERDKNRDLAVVRVEAVIEEHLKTIKDQGETIALLEAKILEKNDLIAELQKKPKKVAKKAVEETASTESESV